MAGVDKIAENWGYLSPLSLVRQISAISTPDCLIVVESRRTVKIITETGPAVEEHRWKN